MHQPVIFQAKQEMRLQMRTEGQHTDPTHPVQQVPTFMCMLMASMLLCVGVGVSLVVSMSLR